MGKKITILDGFSTIHVGNGALIDNSFKILRKAFPSAEIKMCTRDKSTCRLKYKQEEILDSYYGDFWSGKNKIVSIIWILINLLEVFLLIINEYTFKVAPHKIVRKKNKKAVLKRIEESDFTISIFGEVMKDIFRFRLYWWLFIFWLSQRRGAKMIIFPQSFGPIKKRTSIKLIQWSLKNAALIIARDKESFDLMKEIFPFKAEVIYTPDVGFLQESTEVNINTYFQSVSSKKVVGITISKLIKNEVGIKADYFTQIINGIKDSFAPKEYRLLFMPSNYSVNGISNDYKECLKAQTILEQTFETGILENRPYFPDEFQGIQKKLDFFISSRMHVGIIASAASIPSVSINTQFKIRGYMKNLGIDKYCIDMDKLDTINEVITDLKKNKKEVSHTLDQSIKQIKSQLEALIIQLQSIN